MATKQEKLDSLATTPTSGAFHIEPPPKLAEMMMGYGFKRGSEVYDEAMARWVVNLEKSINKVLNEVPTGDVG